MPSPRRYRYRTVDVFTTRQLEGNQLAVFPEATGLDAPTMQRIARELNLAETVFIFPSSGSEFSAHLRMFTPVKEIDFAGHPTIGAGVVLVDEKMATPQDGRFAVEENIGAIAIRVDDGDPPKLWLTTPPIRDGRLVDRSVCATALGIDERDLLDLQPHLLDAGNPTLLIALRYSSAVDRASIDARSMEALRGPDGKLLCVFAFTPTPEGAYSRMFAPDYGVAEDPATSSSTGPLALYMMRNGLVAAENGTHFISEHGTKMARRSMLHVNIKVTWARTASKWAAMSPPSPRNLGSPKPVSCLPSRGCRQSGWRVTRQRFRGGPRNTLSRAACPPGNAAASRMPGPSAACARFGRPRPMRPFQAEGIPPPHHPHHHPCRSGDRRPTAIALWLACWGERSPISHALATTGVLETRRPRPLLHW